MSFTNRTPNLGLPQWIDTDRPTWLVDMNNAFDAIDENAASLKQAGETNKTEIEAIATAQQTQADQIEKLEESNTGNTAQLAQIQAQVNVNTSHLADLDEDIKTANDTISGNKQAIDEELTTINNTVNELSAKVSESENTVTDIQTTVAELNEKVTTDKSNIQTIQTENIARDAKIVANETSITNLSNEQQELSGEVASTSADIAKVMQFFPKLIAYSSTAVKVIDSLAITPFNSRGTASVTMHELPINTWLRIEFIFTITGSTTAPVPYLVKQITQPVSWISEVSGWVLTGASVTGEVGNIRSTVLAMTSTGDLSFNLQALNPLTASFATTPNITGKAKIFDYGAKLP